jgi:hypothetical protein
MPVHCAIALPGFAFDQHAGNAHGLPEDGRLFLLLFWMSWPG